MTNRLVGKVAVVAGGTYGIGLGCATAFASEGAKVVVVGRGAERGEAAVREIHQRGGEAFFEQADLEKYDQIEALASRTLDRFGQVDVLVNSGRPHTSTGARGLFTQVKPEALPGSMHDVLTSRLWTIYAFLGHMIQRQTGSIITITTDAGRTPTPGEIMNGVAGAAMIYFSRSLAREVSRQKVRVNTVAITLTRDTPAWDSYRRRVEAGSEDVLVKSFRRIEAGTPFGMTEPADIANAALFFASDESKQVTGAVLSVNGGISFPG